MSAPDPDGDSTMQSSPASSDSASDDLFPEADVPAPNTDPAAAIIPNAPSTPAAQASSLSELSPPSSQGAPSQANASQPRDASINANGKRIHSTALAGGVPYALGSHSYGGSVGNVSPLQHHALSSAAEGSRRGGDVAGYTWDKESETPGYAWLNKKAMDEWAKAEEMIIEKDRMVRAKYGDPFDWVDREKKGISG
ncbi:hypothetical protein K490DRAFT_55477 [Saccharata proteae CBS 121410]|uniref:Uncharacterized protein n=1 Tax=Saccharata proteae CBS 121410 TaxID=1314787 RepID=A0A6A5YBH8_9PEZI|nr:hypothetical protein K490DRAFT_55477 [Saccharata proteae CBS 121410]